MEIKFDRLLWADVLDEMADLQKDPQGGQFVVCEPWSGVKLPRDVILTYKMRPAKEIRSTLSRPPSSMIFSN